jgi:hypothetical protein
MNERLHNYEMSAIGMKKRRRKKEWKREERKIFFSLALRSIVQGENKRESEDLNQHPSFFINAEIETKAWVQ